MPLFYILFEVFQNDFLLVYSEVTIECSRSENQTKLPI